MKPKTFFAYVASCVAVSGLLAFPQAQQHTLDPFTKGRTKSIAYTDVGHSIQIIGRFGHPLGDYLVLEGKRIGQENKRTKIGRGNFLVEKVNGRLLAAPIPWWDDIMTAFPAGTPYVIEGYETGEMIGVPQEVSRRSGMRQSQATWQFSVRFVALNVKSVNGKR